MITSHQAANSEAFAAQVPDPEADAALARGASPCGGSPRRGFSPAAGGSPVGGSPRGASPQRRPLSRRASFAGDAAVGKLVAGAGAGPVVNLRVRIKVLGFIEQALELRLECR